VSKVTARQLRERRHRRVRGKIRGTADCPRLAVFRSNRGIFAQLVDDDAGKTLAASSWTGLPKSFKGDKTEQATEIGKQIAAAGKKAGVERVVFDRGGYLYHGRVKALAEGAREGGLSF
jgi:large subunit ribosomal protein L18